MLAALSIRDIVLIDQLEIGFEPGLCVLTGETGAGKSILLDALGLTLGGPADAGLVRPGADKGVVTAVFEPMGDHPVNGLLRQNELAVEEQLLLRRVQGADGRTRAFINDQPVSVGLLRNVGNALVEIEGQHAERGLLDLSTHRVLLDAFGELRHELEAVRFAYAQWHGAQQALVEFEQAFETARRDAGFLRHAVEELTALDPQEGEESALAERRHLMMNAEKIGAALGQALAGIDGGEEAGDGLELRLSRALRHLETAGKQAQGHVDPAIAALDRALVEAMEARGAISDALESLTFEPTELSQVDDRLFALKGAARKHDVVPDVLPALKVQLEQRLADFDESDDRLRELRAALVASEKTYGKAAKILSKKRVAAAREFDSRVCAELAPLKLDKATFETRVTQKEAPSPDGQDEVSFRVSTNPGSPMGPLIKIASGGELSRFLLALKVVLAARGSAPTLIFDEVDQGIGGAVADAVGERLARLAETAQVIVVTHSPQVAARANHHWRIAKHAARPGEAVDSDALNVTQVENLDAPGRREEIARMLAGAQVTKEARAAADKLLQAHP